MYKFYFYIQGMDDWTFSLYLVTRYYYVKIKVEVNLQLVSEGGQESGCTIRSLKEVE